MTIHDANTEYLDVVDENNNVIGKETRANIHKQQLFHRAVHIIVLNSKGEMFIQKRSHLKDSYPKHWDVSAAGHLNVGESYEDAAIRELEEELGVKGVELSFVGDIKGCPETDYEFIRIYKCIYDSEMNINPDEIIDGLFVRIAELKKILISGHTMRLTPALKNVIRDYL